MLFAFNSTLIDQPSTSSCCYDTASHCCQLLASAGVAGTRHVKESDKETQMPVDFIERCAAIGKVVQPKLPVMIWHKFWK